MNPVLPPSGSPHDATLPSSQHQPSPPPRPPFPHDPAEVAVTTAASGFMSVSSDCFKGEAEAGAGGDGAGGTLGAPNSKTMN